MLLLQHLLLPQRFRSSDSASSFALAFSGPIGTAEQRTRRIVECCGCHVKEVRRSMAAGDEFSIRVDPCWQARV